MLVSSLRSQLHVQPRSGDRV